MMVIDAGLHIWRAPTAERPWMPGRTAHLPEPIGYEDLSKQMQAAGVQRAIRFRPPGGDPGILPRGRRQISR